MCAVVAAALWASPAAAQYGNSGLALTTGYFQVSEQQETVAVDSGIPIGLEGSRYLENGFETYLRLQGMLLKERITQQYVVGLAPAIGIRYLFNEQGIRPYAGFDLSYLHIFGGDTGLVLDRVGPGVNLGIEFAVSDQLSLGVRAQSALYVMLNKSPFFSLGASAVAATYF